MPLPRFTAASRRALQELVDGWREEAGELNSQAEALSARAAHLLDVAGKVAEELGEDPHQPATAPRAAAPTPPPPSPRSPAANPKAKAPAGDRVAVSTERVYNVLDDLTAVAGWVQVDAVADALGTTGSKASSVLTRLAVTGRIERKALAPDEPRPHPRSRWKYRTPKRPAPPPDQPAPPFPPEVTGPPEARLAAASEHLGRPGTASELHATAGLPGKTATTALLLDDLVEMGSWSRRLGEHPTMPLAKAQLYAVNAAPRARS